MKIALTKRGYGLYATARIDHDNMDKIRQGEVVICRITKPRNIGHHRKFFAMLQIVYENLPEDSGIKSIDQLLTFIKDHCGHYVDIGCNPYPIRHYHSISVESMDQTRFEDFYNRAIDSIIQYILPAEKEDLKLMIAKQF